MTKRHCQNPRCGKPLGSTEDLCHECGGRSFRGERRQTPTVPIMKPVTAGLATLFDRREGENAE